MESRFRRPSSPGSRRIAQPGRSSTGTLIYPSPFDQYQGASHSSVGFATGPRTSNERIIAPRVAPRYRHQSPPQTTSRNDYIPRPRRLTSDSESGVTRRPLTVIPPSSPNRRPIITSAVDRPSSPLTKTIRPRREEDIYVQPASSSKRDHRHSYSAGPGDTSRLVTSDRETRERSERGGYRSGYHMNTPVVRPQDKDDRNYGYEYTDFKKEQYRDTAATRPRSRRDTYQVSARERPLSLTGLEDYLPRVSQSRDAGPPVAMDTRGFTNNLAKSTSLRQAQRTRDDDAGPRDRPRESYGSHSQKPSRAPVSVHQPSDDGYMYREDSKEPSEVRYPRNRKPPFDEERLETKVREPYDDPHDRSRNYLENTYHKDLDREDRDRRAREESHRSKHDRGDDKSDIQSLAGAALASAVVEVPQRKG